MVSSALLNLSNSLAAAIQMRLKKRKANKSVK